MVFIQGQGMILYLVNSIVILYIIIRTILPLHLSVRAKCILSLFTILFSARTFSNYIFGGSFLNQEIPYHFAIIFDILRAILILVFILTLLRDLINLLIKLLSFNKSNNLISPRSTFYSLIILFLSIVISFYGTYEAYKTPNLNEITLKYNNLDPRLKGFSIIQLSDIHLSSATNSYDIEKIVNICNEQNANIIVITGDVVDGSVKSREYLAKILFKLKAKDGVYLVAGNHEYYSGYSSWMNYFKANGFNVLENSHSIITDNGALVNIIGLTDEVAQRYNMPTPNIKLAIENLDMSNFNLLLAHRPQAAYDYAKYNINLMLSGHTHGGIAVLLNYIVAYFNNGFVSGLYNVDNMKLYVSNGTMIWNGFALRIGVPSEITKITLDK